jgi:hypothetical protein
VILKLGRGRFRSERKDGDVSEAFWKEVFSIWSEDGRYFRDIINLFLIQGAEVRGSPLVAM